MTQVVVLLLVMLWAAQAHATTRYVRKGGNNSHSCSAAVTDTDANAKLTILSALACSVAGDTVIVHAGTYDEGWVDAVGDNLPRGTAAGHLAVTGAPGDVVTVTGAHSSDALWTFGRSQSEYYDFTNLHFNCVNAVFCFSLYKSSDFTFTDVEMKDAAVNCMQIGNGNLTTALAANVTVTRGSCHDTYHTSGPAFTNCMKYTGGTSQTRCGSHAYYVGVSNVLFDGVEVYRIGKYGLHFYNGYQRRQTNNVVKNSRVSEWGLCQAACPGGGGHGAGAIFSYQDSGSGAYQNVFFGSPISPAIYVNLGNPKNVALYNNTFYNDTNGTISVASDASGTLLKNNVFVGSTAPTDAGAGTVCAANLFNPGSGALPALCTQTVTGAAKLANPSAGDFHLTSGSSAIDTGLTLSTCTHDAEGVARPQGAAYDLGAFEFGGAAPTPPTGLPPAAPTAPVLSALPAAPATAQGGVPKGGSPS
jgi:hypothetical protein